MKKMNFIVFLILAMPVSHAGICTLNLAAMEGDGYSDTNLFHEKPVTIKVPSLDECLAEAKSALGTKSEFDSEIFGYEFRKEIRPISRVDYTYKDKRLKSQGMLHLPFVQCTGCLR